MSWVQQHTAGGLQLAAAQSAARTSSVLAQPQLAGCFAAFAAAAAAAAAASCTRTQAHHSSSHPTLSSLTACMCVALFCLRTGMDFYVVLERPGYRVARRRRIHSRVGVQHRVTKDDAIKW